MGDIEKHNILWEILHEHRGKKPLGIFEESAMAEESLRIIILERLGAAWSPVMEKVLFKITNHIQQ